VDEVFRNLKVGGGGSPTGVIYPVYMLEDQLHTLDMHERTLRRRLQKDAMGKLKQPLTEEDKQEIANQLAAIAQERLEVQAQLNPSE
jgi:chromosome condensin MukBEF complex kleisin-like MukF subunit